MRKIALCFFLLLSPFTPRAQMLAAVVGQQAGCTSIASQPSGGIYDNTASFTNWGDNATTHALSAVISPDCVKSAASIVENGATAPHYFQGYISHTFTGSQVVVYTLYAARNVGTRNLFGEMFNAAFSSSVVAGISLATCSVTYNAAATGGFTSASATGTVVGGGWCKLAITVTVDAGGDALLYMLAGPMSGAATVNYAGDSTSSIALAWVDLR